MKKRFILLDIDNTLFDSTSYREKFSDKICTVLTKQGVSNAANICDDVYTSLRVAKGLFAPEEFVDALVAKAGLPLSLSQQLLDIIYHEKTIRDNLYSEIRGTLMRLKEYGILGIFSQGKEKLQRKKIDTIQHFFHEDHMHIVENKEKAIEHVFTRYADSDTYLIDDALPILHAIHQQFPSIHTIWMKRGRYAKSQQDIAHFRPGASIVQLDEVLDIIKEN